MLIDANMYDEGEKKVYDYFEDGNYGSTIKNLIDVYNYEYDNEPRIYMLKKRKNTEETNKKKNLVLFIWGDKIFIFNNYEIFIDELFKKIENF